MWVCLRQVQGRGSVQRSLQRVLSLFVAACMPCFSCLLTRHAASLPCPPADSTLLVTGSADKNIKVWGLDFGDCHRSLFAHADSVMAVAFVPNTHYVFTAGGWVGWGGAGGGGGAGEAAVRGMCALQGGNVAGLLPAVAAALLINSEHTWQLCMYQSAPSLSS